MGSRLLEHNAVERAGVRRHDWSDQGALGCFRAAVRNERFQDSDRAGAMEDVVHDGYGSVRIHQQGASGQASVHDLGLLMQCMC